ncbi:MAG: phosphatase PAP2 family protein [Actinomycetales bacterium]
MFVRAPAWVREVLLLGALYLVYELGRMFSRDELSEALTNGRHLETVERTLQLDPEQFLNAALSQHTTLAVVAAYFYSTLHYVVTPIVLVWMYRQRPDHYRFARTTLAGGTLLALAGFYLMPTVPPRLLPDSGLQDTLATVQSWGWWGGDGSVPRGLGGLSNQFAAMPSLHVGWAVWSGVLVARYATHRVVRWLGAIYPLLTTMVVLSTGNHYLLDTVAGAAIVGLGAAAAWGIARLRDTDAVPHTIALPQQRPAPVYDLGLEDAVSR